MGTTPSDDLSKRRFHEFRRERTTSCRRHPTILYEYTQSSPTQHPTHSTIMIRNLARARPPTPAFAFASAALRRTSLTVSGVAAKNSSGLHRSGCPCCGPPSGAATWPAQIFKGAPVDQADIL